MASPVIINLSGDRVTYTKGLGAILLDASATGTGSQGVAPVALGLSDADSADFNMGRLAVTVIGGAVASEDVLGFDVSGTISLSGMVAGSDVLVSGTVIGTLVHDIAAGNDLVVNLNANATVPRVQALMQAVQYENSNMTDPDIAARTVRVTVNDGGIESNGTAEVTVNIQVPATGVFTDSGQSIGAVGSNNSRSTALGDIDNDGDLDMVIANEGQADQLWLNDGSGSYSFSQWIWSGTNGFGRGIAMGDINGDGHLDVVTVNKNSGSFVWLNDGTGTLVDSGQLLGNSRSFGVALGDVDGDGDLDMAVANGDLNALQGNKIWLNDGSGTFTDSGQSLGSNASNGVELGDVDGDGDLDMFVANTQSWSGSTSSQGTRLWINDGSGHYLDSGQDFGSGTTLGIVMGDLDGDGDLDVVLAEGTYDVNDVWLNDGSGGYTNSGQDLGSNTYGVSLGDMDGDGDLDVVFTNSGYRVWLNDGSATFSTTQYIFETGFSTANALGDLDGDGSLDIVTARYNTGNTVWMNALPAAPVIIDLDGDRVTFTSGLGAVNIDAAGTGSDNHRMAPLAAGLSDADSVNFNGGNISVTITNNHQPAEDLLKFEDTGPVVLGGTAAGSGVSVSGTLIGTLANDIAVGNDLVVNFNANATVALVQTLIRAMQYENTNTTSLATEARTVSVTVNDGDGGTSQVSDITVNIQIPDAGMLTQTAQGLGSDESVAVVVGDVDGDGDLDMLSVNWNDTNRLWLNDGQGSFFNSGLSLGSDSSADAAFGDVDGDGDLDMALMSWFGTNTMWLNDGTGSFTDSGQSLGSNNSSNVTFGDVDGDGDLDMVVANHLVGDRVWLNDGSGVFADSGQLLGNAEAENVTLGDVDGDGDLDLAVANWNDNNRIWLNNGAGVFTDSGQALASTNNRDVELGDVDGDGDLDAVIAVDGAGNQVWLNNGSGTFADTGQLLGTADSKQLSLVDMDGDGDLDMVVANNNQPSRVWLNNGTGTFTDSGQSLGAGATRDLATGDFDIDGTVDVLFALQNQLNRVWLNNAEPFITSSATANVDENTTAVMSVTANDLDGDTPTFSISGGDDAALFAINATTGALSFLAAPDFEAPGDAGANNVYEVEVTASDGSGGSDAQLISVTVDDVSGNFLGTPDVDVFNGSIETDTVTYGGSSGVTVHLWSGTGERGDAAGDSYTSIENAVGTDSSDILVGTFNETNQLDGRAGDDYLFGLSGDDEMRGGDGDDLLVGGAGADQMDGGEGDDTISYVDSTSVIVRLWNGTGSSGEAAGDQYVSIENVRGSDSNDAIIGSNFSDNFIEGGGGADYINGLGGNNAASYKHSETGVTVRLWNGTGSGGDAEGDTLVNIVNVRGSEFGDTLLGSFGTDNILFGGGGGDHLFGLSGNDTFMFSDNFGNDVIHDFTDGSEFMDMTESSLSAADLRIEVVGADTIVHFDQVHATITDTITIEGVAAGIDAGDFLF